MKRLLYIGYSYPCFEGMYVACLKTKEDYYNTINNLILHNELSTKVILVFNKHDCSILEEDKQKLINIGYKILVVESSKNIPEEIKKL